MDAGFLNVLEIGQHFMTRDTAEFSQFHAVACREYTLPREGASQPKGWIQGQESSGRDAAVGVVLGGDRPKVMLAPVEEVSGCRDRGVDLGHRRSP